MFQPAAKTGFGAALNGKAVQLAQFVRRHPFGRDAPAVFGIEPHSAGLACARNGAVIQIYGKSPSNNILKTFCPRLRCG